MESLKLVVQIGLDLFPEGKAISAPMGMSLTITDTGNLDG
jgi:hypothetical protein